MLRNVLLVVGLSFAGPAFASECPTLWQQINESLSGAHAHMSETDRTKVAELRRRGEELHHAGDHPAAIAALKEALTLLG